MLLTRVVSDVKCDVFLTDFAAQKAGDGSDAWRLATHQELQDWVGFEVPEGDVEEKGFKYRFEMWVLKSSE